MVGRYGYEEVIEDRAIESAFYICEKRATIRDTAKTMGVSKSTTHKDVTERMSRIDSVLAEDVRVVLDEHIKERSAHGGKATQNKLAMARQIKYGRAI